MDAPCVPADTAVCPKGDFCGGTGRGDDDDDDRDDDGDDEDEGDGDDEEDDGGEGEGDVVVEFEDCETVHVSGDEDLLDQIVVHYMACYGGGGPCPDGGQFTIDDPELPLTIDEQLLDSGADEYRIEFLELFGDVDEDVAERPDDLDCSFETEEPQSIDIDFQMDDETVTLGVDDSLSTATITGTVQFSYSGWDDDTGGVDHAFITTWASSDADIDFPDRDIERYFDVDNDTDTVTKDMSITFDVSPEVGDPDPGAVIETEILGHAFVGLERDPDSDEQQNIGDWREYDTMVLSVEREGA